MAEKTDAQKRAQKKYMSGFVEVKVRMTPDRRTFIQEHAQTTGESVTTFINRAIDHEMKRDTGGPQEAAGAAKGAGVVSLPSEAIKTAQEAAQAAGEAVTVFVARAIESRAALDKRKGGKQK